MQDYFLKLPQMRVKFDCQKNFEQTKSIEVEPLKPIEVEPSKPIEVEQSKFFEEIILILGGRQPSVEWFKNFFSGQKIICVDHGVDFCRENNFLPEILIGDFDSAEKDSLEWSLKNGVKIERHPIDKDFTDTQLALDYLNTGESMKKFAIITGAFGGRFDHLYSTILTCASAKIKNCLVDENEAILFLHSGESLKVDLFSEPLALSLLPLSEICEGVNIDGVHWSLKNAALKNSLPNAISNRVESSTVNISVGTGTLAVYFYFND